MKLSVTGIFLFLIVLSPYAQGQHTLKSSSQDKAFGKVRFLMQTYSELKHLNKHLADSIISPLVFDTTAPLENDNMTLKLFNGKNEYTGLYCSIKQPLSQVAVDFLYWVYDAGQNKVIETGLYPLEQKELNTQKALLLSIIPSQRACDGLNELTVRRKSNQHQ